jgi:hypothetical protein
MTTTAVKEQVVLDLATELGEQSSAKISVKNEHESDAYVSNSIDIHTSADADDNSVWVSITGHTYVSFNTRVEPITTYVDIISHRFTKAEAEALLACLTSELAKLD